MPLIHSPCSRAQLGVGSCCCSQMLFAASAPTLTRHLMSPLLAHQAADVGSAKGPPSERRRRRSSSKGGSQPSLTMGTIVKIPLQKGMESPCTFVPWFWKVQMGREGCSPRGGTTPCSLGTSTSLSSSCLCSLCHGRDEPSR